MFVNFLDSFECSTKITEKKEEKLLALFFKLHRGTSIEEIHKYMSDDMNTSDVDILSNVVILWWHTRATRNLGKGERLLFYDMIPCLIEHIGLEAILATIHLIPHFGYYKDYCYILEREYDNHLNDKIISLYCNQLTSDYDTYRSNRDHSKITFASKYSPSEKGRFHKFARIFAEYIFKDDPRCYKKYRKMRSDLNRRLKTPETYRTNNNFLGTIHDLSDSKHTDQINVPSVCLHRNKMFAKMTNRIHASVLYPHQIIHDILEDMTNKQDYSFNLLRWKSMIDSLTKSCPGNIFMNALCMIDLSETMSETDMEVAMGLGLTINQLSRSVFNTRLLCYAEKITWLNLECHNLYEIIDTIFNMKWRRTSDFVCAIRFLIQKSQEKKILSSEWPSTIFVFSNQKFEKNSWQAVQDEFVNHKLDCPRFVFWNTTNTSNFNISNISPFHKNVCVINGFSPSILKYIPLDWNEKNELTPYMLLHKIFGDPEFFVIRNALQSVKSGIFQYYRFESNIPDYDHEDDYVIVS
tara:strand:+ start:256 stop:1824 length:1569 start_codon:yes stop_codon:yes gene_type:complete